MLFRLFCFTVGLACIAAGILAVVAASELNMVSVGAFAIGGCAGTTIAVGCERIFEGLTGERVP